MIIKSLGQAHQNHSFHFGPFLVRKKQLKACSKRKNDKNIRELEN